MLLATFRALEWGASEIRARSAGKYEWDLCISPNGSLSSSMRLADAIIILKDATSPVKKLRKKPVQDHHQPNFPSASSNSHKALQISQLLY